MTPEQNNTLKSLVLEQYFLDRKLQEIKNQIHVFMTATGTEAAELQLMAFGKPEPKKENEKDETPAS